jgi:hypothetical protein
MDRPLFSRAFIVGIIFFILALAGFYLIFSWEDWQYSHIPIVYAGETPLQDPIYTGAIFGNIITAIIIELVLLPNLAGAVTALVLPQGISKKELSVYSGLAGLIPLALISLIFWAMIIGRLIQDSSGGMGLSQALTYLFGMGVTLLIVVAGEFVAGISGLCVRAVRRRIAGINRKT